jgi:GTPase
MHYHLVTAAYFFSINGGTIRLAEGNGQALYELGVNDDGTLTGKLVAFLFVLS